MQAGALSDRLATLLGPRFSQAGAPRVTQTGRHDYHGWVLDDLSFEFDGEPAPAWFLRPASGRVPAVVYAHAHGNTYTLGRDELTEGRAALQGAYGPVLVAAGLAALCIEMPAFGARQSPDEAARAKAALWQGETLWGQMLAEQRAGVDFLAAHPQVDATRIGALGLSMGCTLAWWLAALDPRIRATSALCCFADMAELVRLGAHELHGDFMTVPGLLPLARTGQIAGLIAPRALQIAVGLGDPLTPPRAFEIARADVTAAYAGASEALSFHIEPDDGHRETPAMRAAVLAFLRRALAA
ncbi:alpha/beta hydrolase family protein [Marinovum sp.]|uniref:alpha/beta hydrolase family protein n=1 Tax=Marinovum sp. TaxID=2024839 RepID=UPI002B2727CF|nr:acetylxylan esterase [Marinovum sp.]